MGLKPDRLLYLTELELSRLLAAARKVSRRDHTLLMLAGNCGLRVQEAVELKADLFQWNPSQLQLPGTASSGSAILRVRTLKQRDRRRTFDELWLHPKVASLARGYIKSAAVDRSTEGWLFPSRWDLRKHITTRAAQLIFKRHALAAGIDPRISFHALRHGHGVALWEASHDQKFVQAGLRHRDIHSSNLYVHLSPARELELRQKVRAVT